jgi:hypothetical protein
MIIKTVAIYTFFDGMLKSVEHKEPINRKTTDSEVITVILLAAAYFGGNIETSISFVHSAGMMPRMLSKSRFNRRMHRTGELPTGLFLYTGEAVKSLSISSTYCIDSFPAAVCRNIRISRCRTVKGEERRGYCASKREYFFGFKVHAVVTSDGIPVEYTFTAGSAHDLEGIKQLPLNLPRGSELTGDSAYTGYHLEEMRKQ